MPNFYYMNGFTGELTFHAGEAIDWYHDGIPVEVHVNGDLVDTWS